MIVWSDMDKRDMALSFQEKSGCDEIWEKICEVRLTFTYYLNLSFLVDKQINLGIKT